MLEPGLPVLIVVEGVYDIHFLKAISALLSRHDGGLPDLTQLEAQQSVLLFPTGGSNLNNWVRRIACLNKREFHIYDREQEPETSERRKIIEPINTRPGCAAVLTAKRALENYLHPAAIMDACGIDLRFGDAVDVPGLLAREKLARTGGLSWTELPYRSQRRLREKAKKVLNIQSVKHMTPTLLAEQDRHAEITGWLRTIRRLVEGSY
jgi:putative ATP-dependent endonuclease of OLD family